MEERNPEHNPEMEDIFRGINDLLHNRPVPPPADSRVEHPIIEGIRAEKKKTFIDGFLREMQLKVSTKDDPREIAPKVRENFSRRKQIQSSELQSMGAFGLADDISNYTLEDLEMVADGRLDFLERELANYAPGSSSYRSLETDIKKLQVIQRASHEARDLP